MKNQIGINKNKSKPETIFIFYLGEELKVHELDAKIENFSKFQDEETLKETIEGFNKTREQVLKRCDEVDQHLEELEQDFRSFMVETGLQDIVDVMESHIGLDPLKPEDLIAFAAQHALEIKERCEEKPKDKVDENKDEQK